MFGFQKKTSRVYLDHAAATPVRPEVVVAMLPYFTEHFANPSAIHTEGQLARRVVEEARGKIASWLQVRAADVFFTASGTESNNLAIAGVLEAAALEGVALADMEVLTTGIEHPSVTQMVAHYARRGVSVREISVGDDGLIDVAAVAAALTTKTKLITLAYVNSEIGTIAPVRKLSRVVQAFNKSHGTDVLIHLDAAQAPLWLPCSVSQLGVDIISLDAGKCCGPKGIGVLARRHGVSMAPYLFGGGQESGLRPGTENTALIVGAALAFEKADKDHKERAEKVTRVRDYAIAKLTNLEGVVLNGSITDRVANNVNISIQGVESEFAAVTLDVAGIACSTKSACGSGKGAGSAVVRTISGGDEDRALTTLRFTLGEETTLEEIDRLVTVLSQHIEKTRQVKQKLT